MNAHDICDNAIIRMQRWLENNPNRTQEDIDKAGGDLRGDASKLRVFQCEDDKDTVIVEASLRTPDGSLIRRYTFHQHYHIK